MHGLNNKAHSASMVKTLCWNLFMVLMYYNESHARTVAYSKSWENDSRVKRTPLCYVLRVILCHIWCQKYVKVFYLNHTFIFCFCLQTKNLSPYLVETVRKSVFAMMGCLMTWRTAALMTWLGWGGANKIYDVPPKQAFSEMIHLINALNGELMEAFDLLFKAQWRFSFFK